MAKNLTIPTNYYVATHWLGTNLILMNQIPEIDESIFDNLTTNCYNENDEIEEIFQFFITDCESDEVEWLVEHFNLMFAYSDKLEHWFLLVPHYGTAWDYVDWTTDVENAKAELGNKLHR